tara:strand:+ start:836 stop:2464 length:1629 start_codon:yes stop_codon:yes gene_type:complete
MATEIINAEIKSNVGQVTKDVGELKNESAKAEKEIIGIGGAFNVVGKALKAAGIGLFVALMAKLMEVFSKNQRVLDAFDTTMTGLSIAFNDLFKFIENNIGNITGYFKAIFEDPQKAAKKLIENSINRVKESFSSLIDTIGFLSDAFVKVFEGDFKGALDSVKEAGKESVDIFTGVDNSVDKITETVTKGAAAISEYTKKTYDQAKSITETNKAAALAAVEFARLNAQYLKDAEVQRQIRDDETKTFKERIAANKRLDEILEEQQELQRAQVQTQIDAAQAQVNMNNSVENRIALGEAQNAMLELEETITGQLSEQKTNAVALDKELLEVQNELRLSTMEGMALELEELKVSYEQKLEMARKAGEDTTALTELYGKQQTAIKDKYAKEEEDIEKAKVKMQADMATQGLQLVEQAAGEGTALAKAAAIAQATISGVQGVQNAFTSANANVGATAASFGAYPVTMAALAGGFAALNIAKIASGGKPSSSTGATADASIPAPQMMSGAFELGGGVAPEPMKAFVVTDEMTNSQDQLANIRRRATI